MVGHEHRWAALARAHGRGIVPQTLLLYGPAQVGKFTLALRYAKLLLCPQPAMDAQGLPAPCNQCRTCHQVETETFPDFRVFRPLVSPEKDEKNWVIAPDHLEGSVITVEMARRFSHEAISRPFVGTRRVLVLNQADRMTIEAQNALLKTFEEPGRSLTILLLADNPSVLLATVRSRSWQIPLGIAPDGAIAQWLGSTHPSASATAIGEAVRVAAGLPGAAWRELQRLGTGDVQVNSRFAAAAAFIDRIAGFQAVGALALTEEAMRLARQWWAEDVRETSGPELKKADGKVTRSAVGRFLDQLATVYRARWAQGLSSGFLENSDTAAMDAGPDALDLIRKTRHYILRNANASLALDVLFGRLIALERSA